MNINEEKQKLRKEYLDLRSKIQNKKEKSKIIMSKVINDNDYINASVIALYKSLKNEVDTSELIKYSLEIGKIVVLPRVIENSLLFYKITNDEIFIKSSFGILEPLDNINNLINNKIIDLVIMPGICFDLDKNRLGFGKGFYDRLLSNGIKNIAICFEEQVLIKRNVPNDCYDIKVKKIITDKKIYR